jgi:serine/threonine protein kinase
MKLEDDGPSPDASLPPAGVDVAPIVQNAYWIQRTIRDAIYGRVLFAVVLKRRLRPTDGADWEVTTEHCAVKEMSWQHIRRESDRLAEDPIKEVAAMQYIKKWFQTTRRKDAGTGANAQNINLSATGVAESFQAMRESNIMMPLDLLTDERNLYSIMPYCDGGELFERLDLNERFSEEEARYWMDQVLNVSALTLVTSRSRNETKRNETKRNETKRNTHAFVIAHSLVTTTGD